MSSKALVIVESPAKAKTINKFLGRTYVVKASMGHVRDLPKKKLGVDEDNDFAPTYEVLKDRSEVLQELKSAAKAATAHGFFSRIRRWVVISLGSRLVLSVARPSPCRQRP